MKKRTAMILLILLVFAVPLFCSASENNVLTVSFPLKEGDTSLAVFKLQERLYDLGYMHFRATGKYGGMTTAAVRKFQANNSLPVDGTAGEATHQKLFSSSAVRCPMNGTITRIFGMGQIVFTKAGISADWVKFVDDAFPVGAKALITDYNTGNQYTVTRSGGKNHADVKLADSASSQTFLTCFGGGSSWEKRAVIVELNTERCAASIFGNPNADGSYCLYFFGSKSDIGAGLPDAEHEAQCQRANGQ